MCPFFQSQGNWFSLYEVSNNILEGILARIVIRTVFVDECYQDLGSSKQAVYRVRATSKFRTRLEMARVRVEESSASITLTGYETETER